MSYSNINELPEGVRKSLSPADCEAWMQVYNETFKAYSSGDLTVPDTYLSNEMYFRELAWTAVKHNESSRFAEVVVSVELVDREGDLADVDAYVKEGQRFVCEGGTGLADHSNKPISTVWKVYKGIDNETQLPCVVVCLNFYRGKSLYDEAWARFRSGKTQWSIGSLTRKTRECNTERCYYRLIPDQWFELSNVYIGLNPRTYVADYNDTSKGVPGILDMNVDVCPVLQKYKEFKKSVESLSNVSANIVDGGTILVHGQDVSRALDIIKKDYPDYGVYDVAKGEDDAKDKEECILVIPQPIDDSDEMMDSMVALIKDEQEAIRGYNTVMKSLELGNYLDSAEQLDKIKGIFTEIIHDEEKHIGGVLTAIGVIDPDISSSIAKGIEESTEESKKGCPAGQHQHPGVVGCHDVFREHHFNHSTNSSDKLDLTNEDIDVNAIEQVSTDQLKSVVVRIAKTLTQYGEDARQRFLASTPGKEFVLMFLELKRREKSMENGNMTEKDAGCTGQKPEPVIEDKGCSAKAEPKDKVAGAVETEKGNPPDILSSIANISSTLASITAVIDQINIRMMKVEEFMASSTENKTDITDAVLSDVSSTDENEQGDSKPDAVESSITPEDKAKEESAEKKEPDGDENGGEANGDHPENDGDEPKTPVKDTPAPDETKAEGDSEKKKEPEAESKPEPPAKKEPEKKPPFVEKEKGKSVKGLPIDAVATSTLETVEPVAVVKPADVGNEPKAAEVKEDEAKAKVEPAADKQPVMAPVNIEPEPSILPPGGGVDFKSAWMKRQAELKTKGVDLTLQSDKLVSLSNEANGAGVGGASNVKLIQPTGIGGFDGAIGGSSSKDAIKNMGKSPETFFKAMREN